MRSPAVAEIANCTALDIFVSLLLKFIVSLTVHFDTP